MMLKIGITGGIGSGKSCVSEILRRQGYPVYDCDTEAKRLMNESFAIRICLKNASGTDFFKNGCLDRAALAAWLFDPAAGTSRSDLVNRIVHPVVREDFRLWASVQEGGLCFMESAILFESGFENEVDVRVAVDAPEPVRLERAIARDASSKEKIEARMRAQMPSAERNARADYVLDNSSDLHSLELGVSNMLSWISSNYITN